MEDEGGEPSAGGQLLQCLKPAVFARASGSSLTVEAAAPKAQPWSLFAYYSFIVVMSGKCCSLLLLRPFDLSVQPAALYPADDEHWDSCNSGACVRCFFEKGFAGMLRKGSSFPHRAMGQFAWSTRFVFEHPLMGEKSWLVPKPYSWKGSWSFGCWVCSAFPAEKYTSSFAKLGVCTREMCSPCAFKQHEDSKSHKESLGRMRGALTGKNEDDRGHVSGIMHAPRLDKLHLAGTILSRGDSFQDFKYYCQTVAISSGLAQGTDISPKVCRNIINCLAEPLRTQDQSVMKHAPWLCIKIDLCMPAVPRFPKLSWVQQS